MPILLAIDTATEACSVALYANGELREIHEVIPRQHSQRLFGMLQQLLPSGNLRSQGIDAIAYGCGPGSFTGLRICASAVQGLAYANSLSAVAVSTLTGQVYTAQRLGLVADGDWVLSTIDAHIGEFYWALYFMEGTTPVLHHGPAVARPENFELPGSVAGVIGIGSGMNQLVAGSHLAGLQLQQSVPGLLPHARDLVPAALLQLDLGELQSAAQVAPVYVREEVSWKKLAEQGKPQ